MPRKWSKQHQAKLNAALERMTAEATPFADSTEAETAARRELPASDRLSVYYPHYFPLPPEPFHREMDELAVKPGGINCVYAFRGAGKSTRAMAVDILDVLDEKLHFIVVLCLTRERAAENISFIKLELEQNARLRADYPGIQIEESSNGALTIRRGRFSARFEPRSIGMSLRSARFRQYRPERIRADDLEDEQLANNPDRERALWKFLKGCHGALAKGAAVTSFSVMLNAFGPGCLLDKALAEEKELRERGRDLVRVKVIPAATNGKPTWPAMLDSAALSDLRELLGEEVFGLDYLGLISDSTRPFKAEWIRIYAEISTAMRTVCYLDPSARPEATRDFKALVAVARDEDMNYYVLDAWIQHASVAEMVKQLFAFYGKYLPVRMGIEDNGFQSLILEILRGEERARGIQLPVVGITHTTSKEDRILRLGPGMEQGRWRFNRAKGDTVTLIEQLEWFPKGHDDGPDALSAAWTMLQGMTGYQAGDYRSGQKREFAVENERADRVTTHVRLGKAC